MKLPMLYSRTSTGATQTWEIEIQENKYRVTTGQVDGKKIVSEWTVCGNKNAGRANETSPSEQAELEARAKWKKKIESGYNEDPSKIDEMPFTEPMLAKSFDDYAEELKYPVWSQPKYDGIRCIATADSLKSRGGKTFASVPHIAEALRPLFDQFPDLILDGELYCDKFSNDFNRICSLVKKAKPTVEDFQESESSIEYWVYDRVHNADFLGRMDFLIKHLPQGKHIKLVPTKGVKDRAELDRLYETYMSEGYEGQMVRLNTAYEQKRSRSLLKRKEFKDSEFEILDVIEGDGNKSGMAASMLFRNYSGQEFNSNIKGNREYLRSLLKSKSDVIGRQATVKYFNLTPDGIPRFPYVIAIRDYE